MEMTNDSREGRWQPKFTRRAIAITALLLAACVMNLRVEGAEPIRALYITGGGWHDYAAQEGILTKGLSERLNINWTIENQAGRRANFWYERFDKKDWSKEFDVIVYNFCITDIPQVERIEAVVQDHVNTGTPAVWLHCSVHCFRADTPRWFKFGGLRSHRHEAHRPFLVEAIKPEHPIMIGFPAKGWQTPQGELYEVAEIYKTATPLAHGFGKDTKRHHVSIWVNEYEGVRVFGTTIGHHNETMADPVYLDFVARGLLWSVKRLNDDGTPAVGYRSAGAETVTVDGKPWQVLFNGENLEGWRPSEENPGSFKVDGGKIVVDGPRGHLFYDGPVANADFKDFHLRAEVYTYPKANSGVFLHTRWQARGWPGAGYEAQVNATHGDRIKTGSIYGVANVMDQAPHEDKKWFLYEIIVEGKRLELRVDGRKVMEHTERDVRGQRRLSSGTIALQAHDPDSRIYYRNIYVRPLAGEKFPTSQQP